MGDQYLRNPCCLFAGDSRRLRRTGRDGTSPDQREFVLVQHRDGMAGDAEADSNNEGNGGVASALIAGRSGASMKSARYLC